MARIIRGKNPRKPWTVRYRHDGRQRERSFGTSKEASDFKVKYEHDSREQIFVDPALAREPFTDAAERWISRLKGAASTKVIYRQILTKHVSPALGNRTLAQVARDRDAVAALIDVLGAAQARQAYNLIRGVVSEAIKAGRLSSSRLGGIPLPVASARADVIFPTHAQLTTLAAEVAEEHRLAIWLMRGCGLRIGEALAVRGDQFNGDTLRITQQLLQGAGRVYGPIKHRNPGDHRDVPVPAYVAELVEAAEPGLLFPGISRRSFERRFKLGREKAGLPAEFTPHSLRHVFASVSLANGVPITDVSRWLGHRNINTTYSIYGHLVPSSWDSARAILDAEYQVWSKAKRN